MISVTEKRRRQTLYVMQKTAIINFIKAVLEYPVSSAAGMKKTS
jgi:hypothetical protein